MAELVAMAIAVDDDDMRDGNIVSPLDLDFGTHESGDVLLSPEDVAWADSCLIDDLAISDSLKHALPDTFPSQTIFSAQESRIFPTIKETGISWIVDDTIHDVSSTNEQEGNSTHHHINNEDTDSFWSRINSENDVFPIYNEDLSLVDASDSEVDSEFSTFVEEDLDAYIFKVWEFDIPDEEEELVKQFNRALAGNFMDSTPSASEHLGLVLGDKLFDDIIFRFDGLSLSPFDC